VSFNPAGTQGGLASDDGPAGMLALGLPVYLDGNIPTTLGGGTETRAIVARFNDLYLWEGPVQARVVDSVLRVLSRSVCSCGNTSPSWAIGAHRAFR
jgi:hypothetical protein